MAAWLNSKSTDTQERKRVGKVAQQNFKQFKEALNKEHTLLFRKDLGFLLYQVGERLFQEHKESAGIPNIMARTAAAGSFFLK